jgi:hypothetical protein
MTVVLIVVAVLVVLVLVAVLIQLPELRRYMKIRSM